MQKSKVNFDSLETKNLEEQNKFKFSIERSIRKSEDGVGCLVGCDVNSQVVSTRSLMMDWKMPMPLWQCTDAVSRLFWVLYSTL